MRKVILVLIISIAISATIVGYIFFDTHTILCREVYSNNSTEIIIDDFMPIDDFHKLKRLSKLQGLGFFRDDVSDNEFLSDLSDLKILYLETPNVTDYNLISYCEILNTLSI